MRIFDKLTAIRACLSSDTIRFICACVFCFFLCTIFMTDNVRMHRNIYYLFVIPLFLLLVPASFFANLLRSSVFLASLAYLVYLWISLFWSPETAPYVFYNEARTLLIMLSFLAITAFYSQKMPDFSLLLGKFLASFVGATAAFSLVWFYSKRSFANWGGLESRAIDLGLAAHPIDSAVTYGLVAVFLIFTLFASTRRGIFFSWLASASLVFMLAFIGLTQTRGVILSIFLIVFLGLMLQKNKRLLLVLGAFGAATLGIILLSMHHPEGMVGFERRFAVRWEIWQVALERASERPWLGFGLNEHQTLYLSHGGYEGVAHNLYLENLLFGGLVGTLLLFVLLALALCHAWQEFRRSSVFLLPAIILFPILSGMSTGYLTLSKIAPEWIQFWLPIGLIIGSELRRQDNLVIGRSRGNSSSGPSNA